MIYETKIIAMAFKIKIIIRNDGKLVYLIALLVAT